MPATNPFKSQGQTWSAIKQRMGALYEDVEKFFGDIFALYGRFLAKYPAVFIIVPLLLCLLFGMGLINIKYENQVEKLYTPMNSQAFQDQERLAALFPEKTGKAFYEHQLIYLGTYGEIIIVAHDGGNIIRSKIMKEIKNIRDSLLVLTLTNGDSGHSYKDLCAIKDNKCAIDGDIVIDKYLATGCLKTNNSFPFFHDKRGYEIRTDFLLGEIFAEKECLQAKALKLRFNLKHDSSHQRQLSLLWEEKFLKHIEDRMSGLQHINITYRASQSLDIELTNHLIQDTKFFSSTIVIMVLYTIFVSSGGDCVSTRTLLAQAGILACLLAILATFGLLSMCGLQFVDICGVMPFLVLGVGVDDMFILVAGFRRTDPSASIEDRISDTFRTSAISITITSLTDLLAFCIGATSPFLSVKHFCIYAGVAVFISYLNHVTFFGGCLVYHARRVVASRHCVTQRRTDSRRELLEQGRSRKTALCCGGQPPKAIGDDDSLFEKIPHYLLPKLLLQIPTRLFITVLFLAYLGVSIWGATQIETGLKLENIVAPSSYLAQHIAVDSQYFNIGPAIMFVVTGHAEYENKSFQKTLKAHLLQAQETRYVDGNYHRSWLDHFLEHTPNIADEQFTQVLRTSFLKSFPQYKNDIVFNKEGTSVVASRFYVNSLGFNDSTTEGNLMLEMRAIAKNMSVETIAYSPQFIYYEHYASILKNTLLAVGVAIIGMLFISLMFIPHPISITCVTVTMISIVLGMFSFMHFWGLALSAITSVQIILSVGFCVDFSVHISHAFMTAQGKNRNDRVSKALEKVGVPILNGALSSIMGILMLAFANSYVFKSFFKTMLLVILLGVGHALFLLPVALSLIGPRRTGKPRVFIPVSLNSRTALGTSTIPPPLPFSNPRPGCRRNSQFNHRDSIDYDGSNQKLDTNEQQEICRLLHNNDDASTNPKPFDSTSGPSPVKVEIVPEDGTFGTPVGKGVLEEQTKDDDDDVWEDASDVGSRDIAETVI